MLRIRKEQVVLFERAAELETEDCAVAMIESKYPEDYANLGKHGVLDLVRFAMDTGATHGIRTPTALYGLVQLYLEFGRDLELAPYRHWALRILRHQGLPGPLKISVIRTRLFARTQGRRMIRHTETGVP